MSNLNITRGEYLHDGVVVNGMTMTYICINNAGMAIFQSDSFTLKLCIDNLSMHKTVLLPRD